MTDIRKLDETMSDETQKLHFYLSPNLTMVACRENKLRITFTYCSAQPKGLQTPKFEQLRKGPASLCEYSKTFLSKPCRFLPYKLYCLVKLTMLMICSCFTVESSSGFNLFHCTHFRRSCLCSLLEFVYYSLFFYSSVSVNKLL